MHLYNLRSCSLDVALFFFFQKPPSLSGAFVLCIIQSVCLCVFLQLLNLTLMLLQFSPAWTKVVARPNDGCLSTLWQTNESRLPMLHQDCIIMERLWGERRTARGHNHQRCVFMCTCVRVCLSVCLRMWDAAFRQLHVSFEDCSNYLPLLSSDWWVASHNVHSNVSPSPAAH